ncbi:serine/threonine-protein kinase dbf2, partial [Massospora cicadina]
QSLQREDKSQFFSMVGSPEYMAPEILASSESEKGFAYDRRVDYWALGCILYEYLAGFPPFTSPNPDEVWLNLSQWEAVLTRPIFEDESLNENFTDLAWDLINNLIALPEKRYSSLTQIAAHPYFEGIDWENMRQT